MSNIGNYTGSMHTPVNYVKMNETTNKVQEFVQYLHDFLPIIEKEFDSLEEKHKTHPNEVFPIKMQALASVYQAAKPLYEWYITKAKK